MMHVLYRQEFDPNGSKASAQAGNTNGGGTAGERQVVCTARCKAGCKLACA